MCGMCKHVVFLVLFHLQLHGIYFTYAIHVVIMKSKYKHNTYTTTLTLVSLVQIMMTLYKLALSVFFYRKNEIQHGLKRENCLRLPSNMPFVAW